MSDTGRSSAQQEGGAPAAPAQGMALVAALAELGARLGTCLDRQALLKTAGEALLALDVYLLLFRVDGPLLVLDHVAHRDAVVEGLEQLMRQPVEGTVAPLELTPSAGQAFAERRFFYVENLVENAIQFLARFPHGERLREQFAGSQYQRGINCPIFLRNEPWGLLTLAARWLTPEDVPALGMFATQLAGALAAAEANTALEHRSRDLAAIHEVATAGHEADLEKLLPNLLRIATGSIASDRAALYLLRPERGDLGLACAYGYAEVKEERHARLATHTALEEVARSLLPRALNVRQWPERVRPDLRADDIEEAVLLPLHVQLRPAGCLLLSRAGPRPYTDEDVAFGKLLAEQIAIQVENARLYAKAQRKVQHLSLLFSLSRLGTEARDVSPLIQGVIAQAVDALSVDAAIIYLVENGKLVLAGHQVDPSWSPEVKLTELRELPLDEKTLVGKAAVTKRAISSSRDGLSELAMRGGIQYAAAAPLVAKDQVVGSFMVVRRASRPFAEDELLLFESCAAHVGVAIEQIRHFEAERQRVRDLEVINELGGLIAQRLELSSVLRSGVMHLSRLTGVSSIYLLLLDPSGRNLRMAASSVESAEVLDVVVPLEEASASTLAVQERRPIMVEDATVDPRAARMAPRRFGARALLAVPLISHARPLGVVVLGDTEPGRRFSPEAVGRAVAIANQLATAIASARLYDDLKRSYDDLARAQAELVRREKLVAVGELAALVAHEVRNPLAVIFNSLTSLRRMLQPEGSVDMLLGIVHEEADRLNRMVGDFLDFARPNEPMMHLENLDQVMADAVEAATSAQHGHAVQVELEIPEPLAPVPCDARLLRQALINLVVNAIQAMPRGGRVTVRATSEQFDGQRYVRVEVRDTGPGIPPNVKERLFEPFYTTKASGTGLGLAVVKRIVEAHHGVVQFETALGQGTTFTLRLPATLDVGGKPADLAAP